MPQSLSRADTRRMLVKLEDAYPDARCALNHSNAFELLIATILSAQCTDERVNMVTAKLFQKYRSLEDYAAVTPDILQEDIKQLGLFRGKADHIVATCRMLIDKFHGVVPNTVDELTQLPGVGRKTANVILANVFEIPAMAVDTHVHRVSNRIGIVNSSNVEDTERQLCIKIPQHLWIKAHNWLIYHGRRVCTARRPLCHKCPVVDVCQFYQKLRRDDFLLETVFVKNPQDKRSLPRRDFFR